MIQQSLSPDWYEHCFLCLNVRVSNSLRAGPSTFGALGKIPLVCPSNLMYLLILQSKLQNSSTVKVLNGGM